MFEFTLKAARHYTLPARVLEARTSIKVAANTREEAEAIAVAALGDPAPGDRWVIRTESIRQVNTDNPSLARAWDEGRKAADDEWACLIDGHAGTDEGEMCERCISLSINPYRKDIQP